MAPAVETPEALRDLQAARPTCACCRSRCRPVARRWDAGPQCSYDLKRVGGGPAGAVVRPRATSAQSAKTPGRDPRLQPTAHQMDRPDVRMEGGQVRQEQRHRLLRRRHDRGRRRRPDEPPGLCPHRRPSRPQHASLTPQVGSAVASDAFFPFRDGLDVVWPMPAPLASSSRAARCATKR